MNKNLFKKAGYISIEVIIVAGVILAIGLFAVTTFTSKGKTATDKANTSIDGALNQMNNSTAP
ncbi:hypothetical protein MKA27_20870 [[Clostridium] innocuum]|uniref:hypothetical protein n=1 Tax=Clostridium innocuum TaxID=1522 RepID=UPI000D6BCE51|nr:hypothetical protein [[Clostridium] innocuum]MCR0317214.1 hypothetical protein [[Clostridium] innocuum]MCR0369775.1 hypothetical protein [[Clostridium] innocuum]MCR0376245.1 hypothetical protein [[Clostridium] innocuum]MCR0559728.1 hypothetical protein [[Clostridium] innocuum]MCR0602578.1 hypothetical protein [[Clostridium] innocuum]